MIPFRDVIPTSDTNPTIVAIENTPPERCKAQTAPINARGMFIIT